MKTNRIFLVISFILVLMCILSSCKEEVSSDKNSETDINFLSGMKIDEASYYKISSLGRTGFVSFGDRLFFEESIDSPQILTFSQSTGEFVNLCYIATCSHKTEECPVYTKGALRYNNLAIDVRSDRLVLYIALSKLGEQGFKGEKEQQIIKYDIKDGKKTVVLENMDIGQLHEFLLWKDYIFFRIRDYETGEMKIYRMKHDGTELKCVKTFSNDATLLLLGTYKDSLYIQDYDLEKLYRTDVDLSDLEEVSIPHTNDGFLMEMISDGYLYYRENGEPYTIKDEEYCPHYNWNTEKYVDVFTYRNSVSKRIKLDDLSSEPEIIAEKTFSNTYIGGNKIYTGLVSHNIINSYERENELGETHLVLQNNMYCGIQEIDLETMESKVVFDLSEYRIENVFFGSENFVVFKGSNANQTFETGKTEEKMFVYDRKAGAFRELT